MEKGETSKEKNVVYCIQRTTKRGKRSKGEPFILKGREVVLGRHPKAEVHIESDSVSRKHAILTRVGNIWSIQDKSVSGVWLNGKQLSPLVPCRLSPSDMFSLGNPKTAEYVYNFSRYEEKNVSPRHHHPHSKHTKAPASSQAQNMQENASDLVGRLENMLQEKAKIEKKLLAQEKKYKASQKQEKELDHLAKGLENQLKRQKREERRLQKELQAQQQECDRSQKREKKLQNQLKKRKKAEDELMRKLRAQKKKHQESMKQKKNLQLQLERKKKAAGKRKDLQQDAQTNDQEKAGSSKVHTRDQRKRESSSSFPQIPQEHFQDILHTQFSCSICSELFVQAHTLSCSHTFCKYCITLWRRKKNQCPICRTQIRSMVHALVMDNFIDQVVSNLSPQLKEHRQALCQERASLKEEASDYFGDGSREEGPIIWQENYYSDNENSSNESEEDSSSEESESEEEESSSEDSSESEDEESSSEESSSTEEEFGGIMEAENSSEDEESCGSVLNIWGDNSTTNDSSSSDTWS